MRIKSQRRFTVEALEGRLVLSAPSSAPPLPAPPPPGGDTVWVSSEAELQNAVANLQSNQTIVLRAGTYNLSQPLYLNFSSSPVTNITIRGESNNPDDVVLLGGGMENPNAAYFGISVGNVQGVTIANLAIGQVYDSPIEIEHWAGADQVNVYHTHLVDAGEQFVKSNPDGNGVGASNSSVQYSTMEYTAGPPVTDHGGGTGYTNGVDVHGGNNWVIRNNLFRNFHTPDWVDGLADPAVLVWNHSTNATVDGNTFINTDRAIAFGLGYATTGHDNQGGVIRNNFVYMDPGLYSADRTFGSDGTIILWDSPGTEVLNNTILTNGNTNSSIEVRFDTTGAVVMNNLADAPISIRDGGTYSGGNNNLNAIPAMFVAPASGDLHLVLSPLTLTSVIGQGTATPDAPLDWDGDVRPAQGGIDIGADQL